MFAAFSNVQAVSASPPALPRTSLPSRANAAPAQRARRAFCSSSNIQDVAAPTSPRGPRILLQPSSPSRANVSPTQRVQPPCLQPFQHTGRLCPTPVLPRTSLLSRVNAAPAQRARRACCSFSNVQAVAAPTSPRRPRHCSNRLSRHARTFPPSSGPRVTAVIPQVSLQSRSNAAPAQRVQPPCSQSFQRTSRHCHAAPRRFRYCSERLSRHARTLPPRSGRNLHVCSLSIVHAVTAPPRRYPEHLFRHARTLPPRSGPDAHFAVFPTYKPSLPPLPRVAPNAAPNVFPVVRERFPHAESATSMFAALQPSLPSRASVSPTQTHERCPRAAGATRFLQLAFQVSLKGQHLHFNRHTAGSGCGRMHASTGPETNGTVKNSPAAPLPRISAVLPHASLQSRSNAAPAQRAQPPCLLSFQRASRRCHAAPRRFRYCSERFFRHAQALPPRSGCNLHV